MSNPISTADIYLIFLLNPTKDGLQRRQIGKVLIHEGHVSVLEDHGLGRGIHGSPQQVIKYIDSLARGQRTEVVRLYDIENGSRPDLIPEVEDTEHHIRNTEDPLRLTYHDPDLGGAHIEVHKDKILLNGQELSSPESEQIMASVKSGHGHLRHGHLPLEKSDANDLNKIEPELEDAIKALRGAVKSGALPETSLKTLTRHVFNDQLVPFVGNKKAYEDFLSRPRKGIHIHIDGNDHGYLNKLYGFETGNDAIRHLARAIKSAMEETVGRKAGKIFRIGGDEFNAHVPSAEHAAAFSRALRAKLDSIPALKGTHSFSASVGYGPTPDHAEESLMQAKTEKAAAGYKKGQAKTHIKAHPAATTPQLTPLPPEATKKIADPRIKQERATSAPAPLEPEVRPESQKQLFQKFEELRESERTHKTNREILQRLTKAQELLAKIEQLQKNIDPDDLRREAAKFGFVKPIEGDHEGRQHQTHTLTLNYSHSDKKGNLDVPRAKMFLGQIGMQLVPNTRKIAIELMPPERMSESVRKEWEKDDEHGRPHLGLPPISKGTKTWSPEGTQKWIPISRIDASDPPFVDHKTFQAESQKMRLDPNTIQPVHTLDMKDGTFGVLNGHHLVNLARKNGMTHIPITIEPDEVAKPQDQTSPTSPSQPTLPPKTS